MCYCFIVFCCLISVIFWRNSTSNWVNFQALNSNFNLQRLSSTQYAATTTPTSATATQLTQKKLLCRKIVICDSACAMCVGWMRACKISVCLCKNRVVPKQSYKRMTSFLATNSGSLLQNVTKQMHNKSQWGIDGRLNKMLFLTDHAFLLLFWNVFIFTAKEIQIYIAFRVDVSVTMNEKRCFILQHKVKRIGWFVVIESCTRVNNIG